MRRIVPVAACDFPNKQSLLAVLERQLRVVLQVMERACESLRGCKWVDRMLGGKRASDRNILKNTV